jgi:hypothetical protein
MMIKKLPAIFTLTGKQGFTGLRISGTIPIVATVFHTWVFLKAWIVTMRKIL